MTRRAVVTGAASGIGAATARKLVANGYSVIAVDVDEAVTSRRTRRGRQWRRPLPVVSTHW